MEEQRQYKRFPSKLPVTLEAMTTSRLRILNVETKDISATGAFIFSKDLSFFEKGKRVIMDFKIPNGSFFKDLAEVKSCIDCRARMVRSTPEGIAVQFN